MDASGADNALLIGHSMGVQVSLEAALCYPKRINGLALLCGSHSRPLDTFQGTDRFRAFLTPIQQWVSQHSRSAHRLMETLVPTLPAWWVAQGEVDGRMMPREDFAPYLEHLAQMNPAIFLRMLESAAAHTTEDRLCDISVPVLVVGGEKDGFTPFEVSERMAKCLPKGELYKIRGGSHTAPLEQPQLMELVLDDWLRRHDFMAKPKTPVRKAVRSRRRSPGRVKKPGS
jgi:pimeloyl-ACP methyl ester carboxylesterase